MDSSRRTSSHRDTTASSSQDSSSRSSGLDVVRQSSTGYDRGYSTRDAERMNVEYIVKQTNETANQEYSENYRSYSTYDAPRLSDFRQSFQTEITPISINRFQMIGFGSEGYYHNTIDLGRGKIIGAINRRYEGSRHLSDIVYNQIILASEEAKKDISEFTLKSWYGSNITNKDTLEIAKKVGTGTFGPEDWQFSAILNSKTGKSKVYLASDHFPSKKFTKISVIPNYLDTVDIEYTYE